MTDDRPIAWMALQKGTPVVTSDGEEIGRVADIIADVGKDIFSGVTFKPGLFEGHRFASADAIHEITEQAVRLSLSTEQAEELGAYDR